ncbi:MAG: cytochrome ubiquinol oxidase subunit I [Nitrospira sp.]|nr:cytochrome ubiquinol oxidase subunit I [Nitrospira sp.]MDH4243705.1 cytochrome ubiquinol oxidase subunit I [Nitrospira sp.]MDH4355844.1 cytochrome ubiquinol oxidase subunit I [Nitrospira sp.]MDH5319009.1 cytochrome ubiquinol oxidase subunit I [Nitrospira sp.]
MKKLWHNLPTLVALFALCVCVAPAAYAQELGASSVNLPYMGNRTAVWVVAQLHILFAAFILGAPIFVVIAEWLGYRKQDPRYDRMAKEITKVTVILFSLTAVTGGFFIFVLLAAYPEFTTWFINQFYIVFAVLYPALFIIETILMYAYLYTWDVWKGEKKGRHIALGIVLNLVCLLILFVINGPTSFMNTPPKAEGVSPQDFLAAATLWDKIANQSWFPLSLHRIDGNVAFGGFIAGMIASYMYMGSKTQEERAYYDWMGFVAIWIAVGGSLLQPFTGLLLAYEMCDYDFSFCPYMMADQLSMFFEVQGMMIGLLFLAINYYSWLSVKRIEGAETVRMTILAPIVLVAILPVTMWVMNVYWIPDPMSLAILLPLVLSPFLLAKLVPLTVSARTVIKIGFIVMLVSDAVWLTPAGFVATGTDMPDELSLPEGLDYLASMPAKLSAIIVLVFVTVVNYVLYSRTIKQGTIHWGKIDFAAQFVLIFLAFISTWIMSLMGAVRSLLKKYFHAYSLVSDFTVESFTPTLSYSAWWITGITVSFLIIVTLAAMVALRPLVSKVREVGGSAVPVEAK